MLELRPVCEHCGKALPPDSDEARICSFECTFCSACVDGCLANVCPNCGGGFERRPVRPSGLREKYPAVARELRKPVDPVAFAELTARFATVDPRRR
ncbi:MAG: DUF1272 domain-containing protein [Planctomycetes bacterium]|nr:DUF1272 domain-containing protein [Planctomycetota bacterium]